MRYVYFALIAALAATVLLLKVQNMESVTVNILSMTFTMPVAVLTLMIYVLGMFTGGFMLQLIRSWIRGASAPRA